MLVLGPQACGYVYKGPGKERGNRLIDLGAQTSFSSQSWAFHKPKLGEHSTA